MRKILSVILSLIMLLSMTSIVSADKNDFVITNNGKKLSEILASSNIIKRIMIVILCILMMCLLTLIFISTKASRFFL